LVRGQKALSHVLKQKKSCFDSFRGERKT